MSSVVNKARRGHRGGSTVEPDDYASIEGAQICPHRHDDYLRFTCAFGFVLISDALQWRNTSLRRLSGLTPQGHMSQQRHHLQTLFT